MNASILKNILSIYKISLKIQLTNIRKEITTFISLDKTSLLEQLKQTSTQLNTSIQVCLFVFLKANTGGTVFVTFLFDIENQLAIP